MAPSAEQRGPAARLAKSLRGPGLTERIVCSLPVYQPPLQPRGGPAVTRGQAGVSEPLQQCWSSLTSHAAHWSPKAQRGGALAQGRS